MPYGAVKNETWSHFGFIEIPNNACQRENLISKTSEIEEGIQLTKS